MTQCQATLLGHHMVMHSDYKLLGSRRWQSRRKFRGSVKASFLVVWAYQPIFFPYIVDGTQWKGNEWIPSCWKWLSYNIGRGWFLSDIKIHVWLIVVSNAVVPEQSIVTGCCRVYFYEEIFLKMGLIGSCKNWRHPHLRGTYRDEWLSPHRNWNQICTELNVKGICSTKQVVTGFAFLVCK